MSQLNEDLFPVEIARRRGAVMARKVIATGFQNRKANEKYYRRLMYDCMIYDKVPKFYDDFCGISAIAAWKALRHRSLLKAFPDIVMKLQG